MATGMALVMAPPSASRSIPSSPSYYFPQESLRFRVSARVLPHWRQQSSRRGLSSIPLFASSSASTESTSESREDDSRAPPPATNKRRLKKMFDYLAQRPVERPNYLLWASGAIFVFLMRGIILEELSRWPGFFTEIWEFLKELAMLVAKLLAQYAKEPTVWTVTIVGWAGLFLLDAYAFIVEVTPVRALITTIALSSAVVSVGEAVRSNAANQPWIIALATVSGLGWFLRIWDFYIMASLLGLLSIASYIRYRDLVTALLPGAATLVAVGEPKIQAASFLVYLALAIYRNWAAPEAREKVEGKKWTSPPIFVLFAIAIGINVAVNWLHARHLVWLST